MWADERHHQAQEIARAVQAELRDCVELDSSDIVVEAQLGAIYLRGIVERFVERLAAERLAMRVEGVRDLRNELEVRPLEEPDCSDFELTAQIIAAFDALDDIATENIEITVRNGVVTLDGSVDEPWKKEVLSNAVRAVAGARRVVNRIRL